MSLPVPELTGVNRTGPGARHPGAGRPASGSGANRDRLYLRSRGRL